MTFAKHIRLLPSLVAGALLIAVPAWGDGDHLYPETTLFMAAHLDRKPPRLDADYDIAVATVFRDVFADDTVLYADVDNPLGGIRFVGLKKNKEDAWRLFSLREKIRLLRYAEIAEAERDGDVQRARDYSAEVPPKPEDVPVERCERPLDTVMAQRIATLWDTMLRGTRNSTREEVLAENKKIMANGGLVTVLVDGTAYHFYTGGMEGQTYNPAKGTAPDLLSKIADAMSDACADSKSLPTLRARVTALEKHLAPESAK
ncbi:MAG TPA: hypothetical protein VMF58_12965 [Rhizomicrobium sp.]|nr:hypothetical protein [Rhizomicrobium sp.]